MTENDMNQEMDFGTENVGLGEYTPGFFKRNKQGITWGLSGLGIGLGGMVGQWFYDRAKRNALLGQIELALAATRFEFAQAQEPGDRGTLEIKGKPFNTASYIVTNNADLQQVIQNHMISGKIKGKERARWISALTGLVQVSQHTFETEVVARHERTHPNQ
jgi:hypothetical protein